MTHVPRLFGNRKGAAWGSMCCTSESVTGLNLEIPFCTIDVQDFLGNRRSWLQLRTKQKGSILPREPLAKFQRYLLVKPTVQVIVHVREQVCAHVFLPRMSRRCQRHHQDTEHLNPRNKKSNLLNQKQFNTYFKFVLLLILICAISAILNELKSFENV